MTSSESINTDSNQKRVVAASNSNGSRSNGTSRPVRVNSVRRRSYADWITRAIQSSPQSKMTLAAIYNWMAANVPGLYEKRNLHSSKGWKNAVRHTLSVNRRFQKSSQPNVRAALWSITPSTDSELAESPESQEAVSTVSNSSSSITSADLPSCSTLFTCTIPVTTCIATSRPWPSPTSTSSTIPHSSMFEDPGTSSDSIVTQTLELHHQDGTVRTVTVPKLFPIHVVSDYRLVTIDTKQRIPTVVTSGS